ncbi:MAG: hypothetical protein P8N49_04225 [Opitutales bacterium]|nr:hypothetical protein [Opitutales bacterium]
MEPREVIADHLELCARVHDLLLEENTWLKTKNSPPTHDFLAKKQEVLPQLENSLLNLRKLKPEYFSPFDDSKQLVGQSHAKLLQIFYLDRENEELLLKLTQSGERQSFNRFASNPEEIDEIHDSLPSEQDLPEEGTDEHQRNPEE